MYFLQPQYWPIIFICAAMLASAIIDWWKFKVPNVLTMPVIVLGWMFGLMHNFGWHIVPGDGVGGIGAALAGTAMGSLLLLAYIIGGMGAGDVKMCMGFGAWIGAFYGIVPGEPETAQGQALWIILYAQFAGILVGGVIGMVMILLRMEFKKNVEHARSIVMDAVTTGSIGKMAERANERRPRWHRLPYGVPMCIGFLGYLWMMQPVLNEPAPEQTRLATASHLARVDSLDSPNSAVAPE
jgi:prepilin peptidase CpaA